MKPKPVVGASWWHEPTVATLGEYMAWLRKIDGNCKSGIGADPVIGMVPITKLIAPNGKHVIFPSADQSEELSTYMIEQLDRRLGVLSPFRSVQRG